MRRLAPGRHAGGAWIGIRTLALAATLATVLVAGPVAAQTNLETNSAIQFNFAAPGAANLALGGAFIGLAFDGTAAYTNPAGLTTLLDPELWLEARRWGYTHVYTDRGRIEGQEPTGLGEPDEESFDNVRGLREGRATNDLAGPSFVSYVHPARDWSFALYGHKLLDFEAEFSTRGAYLERIRSRNPQGLGVLGERVGRLPALRNRMETEIDSVGVAVARRLTRTVSIGGTLSSSRFRIDSLAERFVPPLAEPPDFGDVDDRVNTQTQRGDDSDWSYSLGALWRSPGGVWSAGAVYRAGPEFAYRTISESAPEADLAFRTVTRRAVFHVPDVYGVGLAWRPTDRFTLAVDYDRVEYSDLLDDFVDIFGLEQIFPGGDAELNRYRIDDADELHAGVEFWLPRGDRVLTVRFGGWYDPDHSLRFEGENPGLRAVFRGGKDQLHATAGVGLGTRAVQVDLAVDYADRSTIVSLSAGMRF